MSRNGGVVFFFFFFFFYSFSVLSRNITFKRLNEFINAFHIIHSYVENFRYFDVISALRVIPRRIALVTAALKIT